MEITKKNISDYILGEMSNWVVEHMPLDNTYSRGFEFDYDDRHYKTEPNCDKDGKLIVTVDVTTWEGILSYAKHYYGTMTVRVDTVSGNRYGFGYFGDVKIPKEKQTLKLELRRPVTEEDIDSNDFDALELGLGTCRFNSEQELKEVAEKVFSILFDTSKCKLVYK